MCRFRGLSGSVLRGSGYLFIPRAGLLLLLLLGLQLLRLQLQLRPRLKFSGHGDGSVEIYLLLCHDLAIFQRQ